MNCERNGAATRRAGRTREDGWAEFEFCAVPQADSATTRIARESPALPQMTSRSPGSDSIRKTRSMDQPREFPHGRRRDSWSDETQARSAQTCTARTATGP